MRETIGVLPIRAPSFRWGHVAAAVVPLLLLACSSQDPSPFVENTDELFWKLELNHRAVVLSSTAPWDTLTLVATPRDPAGRAMTGLPAPQYASLDPTHVVVSPDGVLHAVDTMAHGTTVVITATLSANGITHADTARVSVWATSNPPPVLASFSIHPVPPDSAKTAIYINLFLKYGFLRPRAADPDGASIDDIPVDLRSSDNTTAHIDLTGNESLLGKPGTIIGARPGNVTFYATTTVFGVTKADTLPYRIGLPLIPVSAIQVRRLAPTVPGGDSVIVFSPSEVTVGTGALVQWLTNPATDGLHTNPFPEPADLVFDDADLPNVADPHVGAAMFVNPFFFPLVACDFTFGSVAIHWDCNNSGNALVASPLNGVTRVFTAPGIYDFHSAALGASGRVIVVDER